MHSSLHPLCQTRRLLPLLLSPFLLAFPLYSQEVETDQADNATQTARTRPKARFVPGRVLVLFDPAVADSEAERTVTRFRGRTADHDPRIGLRVVELEAGANETAAAAAFRAAPGVVAAELDEIVEPSQVIPNDPLYSQQAHLAAIKGPMAWQRTTGSPGVIVAVIDTGVNGSHPDLAGRLVPGWNTYDNNSNFADVYGHGTKVAGTIVTATNNGVGVASICWNCMLMPIRASQPSGSATFSALAAGVTWAADRGARVANISYQVSSSSAVTAAAQYFMSKGGLVFSSAGNYATNDPAPDNPFIVTVSAIDPAAKALYSWSNFGNNIDVTAPGCAGSTTLMNLSYGSGCGTSYASPIAAGVAALIFSANPNLTAAQALEILKASATDLGPAGWDIRFGHGMVDAAAAVSMASGVTTADTRGPSISISSPVNGAKVKGAMVAAATVTDAEGQVRSVQFRLGGSAVCSFAAAPYSCSVDTKAFPDGPISFTVTGEDDSGNVTTTQLSIVIENADVTKPTVSLTAPAAGATVSGPVTIVFMATDNVGVTSITVTAGSATLCSLGGTATTCLWDTTKSPNGAAVITVTARDAAGNTQAASVNVTVNNVDQTPPSVTLSSPAEGATVKGQVTIAFSVSDNVAVTQTTVAAGSTTLCSVAGPASSCAWNTLAVPNGPAVITVTAADAAGNRRSVSVNVTVQNADTTKPVVNLIAPLSGAQVSGTVAIQFSASDNVGVAGITVSAGAATICSVAGSVTSCQWNTTLVANGSYTITVTARDEAGNTQSASAAVTVNNADTTPPVLNVTAPAAGATLSGTATVAFSASDNVAVTAISVSANGSVICSLPGSATSCAWNTTSVANGAYTITVSARDAAGNSQSVSRTVTVSNADKTPPTVTFTAPAAGAKVTGTVNIVFSATDNVGVTGITVTAGSAVLCSLAGAATSCPWDTTKTPNGAITITVTARDAAANTQSSARSVTVDNPVTDTVRPTVSFTTALAGAAVRGTVTLGVTSSDNVAIARVVLAANGLTICTLTVPTGSCAWNTLNSPNGAVTLTATAFDTSGNSATAQMVVTVVNGDAISPTAAFVLPTTATLQGDATIQVTASDNVGVVSLMVTANGRPICNLGGGISSCTWATRTFPNGAYTLVATARDAAGNSGSASMNVTVSNVVPSNSGDAIRPMAVVTSPAAGSVLRGVVPLSYVGYDDRGVTRAIIRVNTSTQCNINSASGSCIIDTTKFPDGVYNFVAVVYDAAGNGNLGYIPVIIANKSNPSELPQLMEEPTLDDLEEDLAGEISDGAETETAPAPEDPETPEAGEEPHATL